MSKRADRVGQTIGSVSVLSFEGVKNKSTLWKCECKCGNQFIRSNKELTKLKNAPSFSCMKCFKGPFQGYKDFYLTHWNRIIKQAEDRGYSFDLTIEEAWDLFEKQDRQCALSGIEIELGKGGVATASLDRIDSTKGYEISNVQWVHKVVNRMKLDLPQDEFVNWCKLIASRVPDVPEIEL